MHTKAIKVVGIGLTVLMFAGCGTGATKVENNVVASGAQVESTAVLRTILVDSQESLDAAIKTAVPGDNIALKSGTYRDLDISLRGEGTAENPIFLSAEVPGKVVLSGQSSLRLGGKRLVASGLIFRGGYTPRNEVISFRTDSENLAYDSQVTNVVIDNYSNPDRTKRDLWVGLYGKNNSFDRNHLEGKLNAGPTLAVRLNAPENQENGHRIEFNYFGPRPVFGSNGGETFRIGTSHYSLTNSNTIVENNFFDRCSGEVEIVSSKSGGNVFRGNTFHASRGTLTLRHGNGTLIEGNLFDGAGAPYTGGVRVINAQQTIRNNYFKDLTGNRFSGALVVMNGVPNSPINRYHQVDGASIEGNVFDNVRAIELGEGSDLERTAVPINSSFKNNTVIGADGKSPFELYDDMSGIVFADNVAVHAPSPEIAQGFDVGPVDELNQTGSYGVEKDATGVSWYPKASEGSPFGVGKKIVLTAGTDVLSAAVAQASDGDVLVLMPGNYHESTIVLVEKAITIEGNGAEAPVISFERPNLFELTGGGSLSLVDLKVTGTSAPDGSGNSLIATSSKSGSGNHILLMDGVHISDFDVNRGFSAVSAKKGTFFDKIDVRNSSFNRVSGTVFKLDAETDDYGIYNAEYLTITDSVFTDIGDSVANVYRGGRDESTFGPHIDVSGSSFFNVGKTKAPVLVLHGVQKGSFVGNKVENGQPIGLTYTTGLPIFEMDGNMIDGAAQSSYAELTDLRNR